MGTTTAHLMVVGNMIVLAIFVGYFVYLHCFKMMAFGTEKANISIEHLRNEKTTDCLRMFKVFRGLYYPLCGEYTKPL